MERTTDLDLILANPQTFWLGEVVTNYEVGPYQIIEYYQWMRRGCEVLSGQVDYNERRYAGFLNGKQVASYSSLDGALAGLIAVRQEGQNSRAGYYFIKMLRTAD